MKLETERKAYRGVLRFFDLIDKKKNRDPGAMKYVLKKDNITGFAVSRRAGYLIGRRLFELYNTGTISGADLRDYVFEQESPFFLFNVPVGKTA